MMCPKTSAVSALPAQNDERNRYTQHDSVWAALEGDLKMVNVTPGGDRYTTSVQDGDVRLQVNNALLGKRKTAVATVRHRRALLIDEVPDTLAPSPPAPALHLRRAVRFR